ncbi:hypothetical protein ABZX39_34510 [Streptomyces collinus]|uniref:hypothetical protein n=1 Tax=Streptomyces collinus TaxID=42684 RepID=UPI0033A3E809
MVHGPGVIPHTGTAESPTHRPAHDGVADIGGAEVFTLRMLQARDPRMVGRQFFAHHDPSAEWLDDLRPALGSWWP